MEFDHHHQESPLEMTFTEEQKADLWQQVEKDNLELWGVNLDEDE